MKFLLSTFVLTICGLGVFDQQGTDRELDGRRGKVKLVENWSQDTERDESLPTQPVYSLPTNTTRQAGTYYISGGWRSIYFLLDGKRVSRYEQFEDPTVRKLIAPVGTVETPAPPKLSRKRIRLAYSGITKLELGRL